VRLGELLLGERRIRPEQLAEALESQVVYGGRLGTNLVELGVLSEQALAEALGRLHRMPHVFGDVVPAPEALLLVPAKIADDKDVVPLRVDSTRISLAVMSPKDLATLDMVAFKTGKRVFPIVMPELRINMLLRQHYRAIRPLRGVDSYRPGPRKAPTKPASLGDLMSEEEFTSMYAERASGPKPALSAPAPMAFAPPETEILLEADMIVEPEETLEAPPPPPLTFAQAQAALAQSQDREAVATNVLRFAMSKFKRALLLSVHRDIVSGWRAMGQGVHERKLKTLALSLGAPSSFKLVRDTSSHFIGQVKDPQGLFYPALGEGAPTTAVMMPLLARGKVVHILYVDNGPNVVTPPDLGELLILSQSVARSYEALIAKRAAR
jgi:hypothetical protein